MSVWGGGGFNFKDIDKSTATSIIQRGVAKSTTIKGAAAGCRLSRPRDLQQLALAADKHALTDILICNFQISDERRTAIAVDRIWLEVEVEPPASRRRSRNPSQHSEVIVSRICCCLAGQALNNKACCQEPGGNYRDRAARALLITAHVFVPPTVLTGICQNACPDNATRTIRVTTYTAIFPPSPAPVTSIFGCEPASAQATSLDPVDLYGHGYLVSHTK